MALDFFGVYLIILSVLVVGLIIFFLWLLFFLWLFHDEIMRMLNRKRKR